MLFGLNTFSGGVYPPSATSRTIFFFLFPIVFGINLIHLFDEKKDGAAENSIACFGASIPVTPFDRGKTIVKSANFTKNANCFEECNVFSNGKCELSAIEEGRNKGAKFWQAKVQTSPPILKVQFFGKKKCKTHRQF